MRKILLPLISLILAPTLFGCHSSSSGNSGSVMSVPPPQSVVVGQINPNFGTAGYASTSFGTTSSAFGISQQSTGEMVLLLQNTATPSNNNDSFYVARFTTAGTLDPTFGTLGQALFQCSFACTGSNIVVEADDKVLVVANTILPTSSFFTVVRFNANGGLDTSYGTSGVTATANGTVTAAYIDLSTDNLIITGTVTSPTAGTFIERLLPTGALDTTFNNAGVIFLSSIPGFSGTPAITASVYDSISLDYLVSVTDGSTYLDVASTSAGVVDPNFGGQGYIAGVTSSSVSAIAVQPNGSILLGSSSGTNFKIMRLLANGQLDTSFGTGGVVTSPSGDTSTGSVNQIIVDGLGNVVVVYNGTTVVAPSPTSQTNLSIFRFTSTGVLDTTFGGTGSLVVPFESASGAILSGGMDLALAISGAGGAQILEIQ